MSGLSEMVTVTVVKATHAPHRFARIGLGALAIAMALWGAAIAPPPRPAHRQGRFTSLRRRTSGAISPRRSAGATSQVTSLITSPTADPHLFETNAHDAATLAQAQVVIENGAGYDTWMGSLLSADGGRPRMVNAASVLHVTGSDPNPHLWYNIPHVPAVAAAIAAAFTKAAPQDASTFAKHLATFDASLDPLEATLGHDQGNISTTSRWRIPNASPAISWPQPTWTSRHLPVLLVRSRTAPIPARPTRGHAPLLTDHDINVLLYNVQTVTPVTTQMRTLAKQHDIPVVGVSETMPAASATYQQWQATQLTNLLHALQVEPEPVAAWLVRTSSWNTPPSASVHRALWSDLDLAVADGEFLAVLGPEWNRQDHAAQGLARPRPSFRGGGPRERPAARAGQSAISATSLSNKPSTAAFRSVAATWFVSVWTATTGAFPRHRRAVRRRVDAALEAVGASAYADAPVGLLSGGEQQRLRIAQALLGDPRVLLCDEPLLALDLASQRAVTRLLDDRRRDAGTPVLFVTHEINPVLPYVDRILYLVRGRWAIGTPAEILTSERLSALYGIEVDVVKVRDRYLVVSAEDEMPTEPGAHAHHDHPH